MSISYEFALVDPDGTRVELRRRDFDGVETNHDVLATLDIDDARTVRASLDDAMVKVEANARKSAERRREALAARKAEIEREMRDLDAELAKA